MRREYKRYTGEDEQLSIDMTPMLDIVFIMLIFFIVTTSFIKVSGIDVDKPKASSAKRVKKQAIIIAIGSDGTILVDKKRIDIRALRHQIERLYSDNPKAAVVISADSASRTGLLVRVMDQVKLAGVEHIAIGADSDEI